jgi:dihydroxy-acid dehydratase
MSYAEFPARDILTRNSFLNAIVIINVLGGSTNAVGIICTMLGAVAHVSIQVLHLLAMARAADVELSIDDFQEVADRTPYLADLKCIPSRSCTVLHFITILI